MGHISHWNAWKFPLPSFHLRIATWQQALLQLDFYEEEFYFKGLVIHTRIRWSKMCCPITIKGKRQVVFLIVTSGAILANALHIFSNFPNLDIPFYFA